MIKEFIKDNKYKILIEENTICIRNYIRIEDISPLNIKIKFNDIKLLIKGKNLIINKLDSYYLCSFIDFYERSFVKCIV